MKESKYIKAWSEKMRKNVVRHYCDVCDKEVKSSDELTQVKIPVDAIFNWGGLGLQDSIVILDVCPECRKALRKAIKENFAEIVHTWDGEIKIKKIKYKTREGIKDR